MAVRRLVIIGSGPAGFTAGVYAARANLKPLMFEGFQKGGIPGGQLMTTTEVENFPGFPHGIPGPELMKQMREQAVRFGTEVLSEDVESVDFSKRPFTIRGTDTTVQAKAVVLATGANAKYLGLPSEERLKNRGVSGYAVCDGALPLFRNQELVVVGGVDRAIEEGTYLTK